MFTGIQGPSFRAADNVAVKLPRSTAPATMDVHINRLLGTYNEPVLQPKRAVAVIANHQEEAEAVSVDLEQIVPLRRIPSSPPPSRICEDDERRIMLKMEQLLKNEARIVEVEEENRVLTRMVMRLQAENDALKAQ